MGAGFFYFGANMFAFAAVVLMGASALLSAPRSFDARVFAAAAASGACYLLGRLSYAVPAEVQVHFRFWPFLLVFMNMAPGLWMILAYSLFQDRRGIPRWMTATVTVQVLLSAVNAIGYVGRDNSVLLSPAYPAPVNVLFGPVPLAMQAVFAAFALFWAIRGWRSDLDEGRRLLRGLFLVAVGGLSLGVSAVELYSAPAAHAARTTIDNAVTVTLALGYGSAALAVLRFDGRLLERIAQRLASAPNLDADPEAERDLARLTQALEQDKLHLEPGLTIGRLAKRIAMPEYRLRALINRRLGYRNFNSLLHDHRLRDACAQLTDPAKAHLPILTIALDVGYQSITPFNQAFREAMGCTPSDYRRRAKGS